MQSPVEANPLLHKLEEQNEELHRIQAELEYAKAQYSAFYDLAPVGYLTVGETGLILEANLTAAGLLGMARDELLRQPLSRFLFPEDQDICRRYHRQLAETRTTQSFEMRIQRQDGSFSWAHMQIASAHSDECLITLSDITERKQNESRLTSLVRILQHPAETIQGLLDYALDQAIHLTGSKIGCIYHYHEERRAFVLNTWSREVMAECAVTDPLTCYELDKTGIWGEAVRQRRPIVVNDFPADNPRKKGIPKGHVKLKKFMTVPIFQGENIVGVIGLANKESDYEEIDLLQVSLLMEAVWKVTDRMKAEIALRESVNRYAMTIAAVNDGIWDWDVTSGSAFFSPLYYSLLGYAGQAFPANYASWRKQIHPDDLDRVEQLLQQSVEKGQGFNIDLRMKTRYGEWLWVCTRGNAVERDANGRVRRMVGTLSDISERKHLEAQLRQAQKMEAIGTLAGGIAHDFNNILTAILGFGEIVLENLPPDSPLREDQACVIQSGRRAAELVKQILSFSRQTERRSGPLLVQFVIKETLKLLRASLPTTIEIREDIDVSCGPVMADPIQIHQLLMNLCTNAKQAMGDGVGILSVSLKSVDLGRAEAPALGDLAAGPHVVLEISDTGCGIKREIQKRIFDPYFTTKDVGEGSGLGLAVVHGIVTVLGGAVVVDSEPGRGATFRVYLPMVEDKDHRGQPPAEVVVRGKDESVLVIDDEEVIANLEARLLESLGYRVTKFTDSALALQAFQAAPESFDLIVTDMTMPKLNGAELAREVMRIRPELPVILCTGYSEAIDQSKAEAMGIKELLMKPPEKDQLARVVRKALDRDE